MTSLVRRNAAVAALVVAVAAFVVALTGPADAQRDRRPRVSTTPRPYGLLQLNRRAQFPARAIPTVRRARSAQLLGDRRAEDFALNCNAESVDMGTWCLMNQPYPLPPEEVGRNNYFFATQKGVELGGYLPTAAQLVGAANRVKLASTIDDDRLTAAIDEDPTDGLRDRREMSATLITTQSGSNAAGSQGVSEGSRGNPRTGEPDPAPQPAVPAPESLQYVTVYDNRDRGGFAGARPVSQPEQFRCAFDKAQGSQAAEEG